MQVNALNHAVHDQQDAISGTHWILGAIVGFVTVGPALAFGVFQTVDQPYPLDLWYKVWGPFAVVTGIEIWAASWLAPVIGLNMIKERSNGVSLKETMRSNLTTQGLISALFLTIVYAMLQADAPMEDPTTAEPNEFAVLSQWYMMLVTLSLTMVMIGTIATVLLLLYIEPLDEETIGTPGVEFLNRMSGNNIPPEFLPAIEKGFKEAMDKGPLSGAPVMGVGPVVGINDVVKIPSSLPPGKYVLGWRYDCEATAQVWSSCADVMLVSGNAGH